MFRDFLPPTSLVDYLPLDCFAWILSFRNVLIKIGGFKFSARLENELSFDGMSA